jgi:hypothetical protein
VLYPGKCVRVTLSARKYSVTGLLSRFHGSIIFLSDLFYEYVATAAIFDIHPKKL